MAESPTVKKLREQLDAAMARDKLREAVDALLKLERVEPADARWPHRLGDLYRRMRMPEEAVRAYERAVERYARGGFLARAVAMAKTVTSLDPARGDVLSRLTQDDARNVTQRARKSRGHTSIPPAGAVERPPSIAPLPPPEAVPALDELASLAAADGGATETGESLDLDVVYIVEDDPQTESEPSDLTVERLALFPLFALFAEVPREALLAMASECELLELGDGELVVRRGDAADALYAIVQGAVRVQLPDAGEQESVWLGEGEVFGEACLLHDEPRHADVVVAGSLTALRITKRTLDALVAEHASVGRVLLSLLSHRLVGNLMRSSPVFAALDHDTQREVVSLFELRKAPHGIVLFEAGEAGDGLYIPLTGKLRVLLPGGQERMLPAGSVVGISSLLVAAPIAHTVETVGDMLLLRLPAARFMGLIMQYPSVLEELTYLSVTDALG